MYFGQMVMASLRGRQTVLTSGRAAALHAPSVLESGASQGMCNLQLGGHQDGKINSQVNGKQAGRCSPFCAATGISQRKQRLLGSPLFDARADAVNGELIPCAVHIICQTITLRILHCA